MIHMMELWLKQLDLCDVIEVLLFFNFVHQWDTPYYAFVLPPLDDRLPLRQDVHIFQVIHFDTFLTWSKYCRVAIGRQDWYTDQVVS